MDFFSVLTMMGGLALFLYGMVVLGDGLSKVSGGRLEKILEKITSNPIKAVALGAGVTAVIQSSSATTVMVVGFVNSGIMKLSQAIGVIMGANIGTTVTSWILSLSGIESDNFFIRLLKPTSFSPVLALIGIIFIMFSRKEKTKDIGTILVGFAVLMFGMETMSSAVKPLAEVPQFTSILTMFSNPILGIIAGAILTAIIQSSSASVGILQALCATGAVSVGTALPIIMGQNIGTCITAILSGIGASKNARRAALVHLYFNIIGVVSFMVVFYGLNAFMHFGFLGSAASATSVAIIHSVFNIVATLVLLPFSKGLEKLAYLTIQEDEEELKGKAEEETLQLLDSRFLDKPGLATSQCMEVGKKMAELSRKALFESITLVGDYHKHVAEDVVHLEGMVDRYEDELGSYLIKLSSRNLSERDSHVISVLLHSIGDFERISDHAVNIMRAAKEMKEKDLSFSNKATVELEIFSKALQDVVDMTVETFENQDLALATQVEPLEQVMDYLNAELKKRHVKRLRRGKCTIEMGFVLSDIITSYERVADHCSNIAVCILQVHEDAYDTHNYTNDLKQPGNVKFGQQVESYKERYLLP